MNCPLKADLFVLQRCRDRRRYRNLPFGSGENPLAVVPFGFRANASSSNSEQPSGESWNLYHATPKTSTDHSGYPAFDTGSIPVELYRERPTFDGSRQMFKVSFQIALKLFLMCLMSNCNAVTKAR